MKQMRKFNYNNIVKYERKPHKLAPIKKMKKRKEVKEDPEEDREGCFMIFIDLVSKKSQSDIQQDSIEPETKSEPEESVNPEPLTALITKPNDEFEDLMIPVEN